MNTPDFEVIDGQPPEKKSVTSLRAKYYKAAKMVPGAWVKVGPYDYYPSAQYQNGKRYGFDVKLRKEGEDEIYMYVRWPNGDDK